jgi:nucleoside phosphorylase
MASEVLTYNDYTVGWVCALSKEQTAATAMLDEEHADLPTPPNDHNTYTLGRIGKHNIVIACLPEGEIGNSAAATVAARMTSTFPSIKFGLMVGIGGGVPPTVRLGDVVVSTPANGFGGVVQWDLGKAEQDDTFRRTGCLDSPPNALRTVLTKLKTKHEMKGSMISQYLEDLKTNWPRLAAKYTRSESLKDVLFRADCNHVERCATGDGEAEIREDKEGREENNEEGEEQDEEEKGCINCDRSKIVKRKARNMRVHYGLIASGNQVIKDAAFRDKVNKRLGGRVLCFEMEAAGLMNDFPCIVIRGICDYADSHKNKAWQEHAAAVAAAFAKEFLLMVPAYEIDQLPTIASKSLSEFHLISDVGGC